MAGRNQKLFFVFILLVCVFLITCINPIMEKWWVEDEQEYIPITKMIPEITYQSIIEHEVVYETVFVRLPPEIIVKTITVNVPNPPTEQQILEYIKNNPDKIIEIIKTVPGYESIIKTVIREQPPQLILQTIDVIDIEYIVFSGDASVYNANSPTTGGTNLTAQEKTSNDLTIEAMAKALKDNPDYLMILHGHANPTKNPGDPDYLNEIVQLGTLSLDRANNVNTMLLAKFSQIGGSTGGWGNRVSTKGYGGERNFIASNSLYASLNRRVEMILVRVGVE